MASKSKGGVSFRPDSYVEGGGLLGDVDVTFVSCEFLLWDYNGNSPNSVPAFKAELEVDGQEEHVEQYFSCGKDTDWEPSEDGKSLVPIGKATGLNKNCNFAMLVNSMIEAGFPADKIDNDCSIFEGLVAHVVRVPEPKRPGLVRQPRADGKEYEKTIMVVDSIIKLPWEGKNAKKGTGAAKKGTTAAKGKEAEETGGDDEIKEKVQGAIMEILAKNPKGIDKKKLAGEVFKYFKDDPDKQACVKLAYDDDFLGDGMWTYEDGKVSM
jgi:hypothetical protein